MALIDASTRWSYLSLLSARNHAFTKTMAQLIKLKFHFLNIEFSLSEWTMPLNSHPVLLKIIAWWRTETANHRGGEWMGADKNSSRRRWRLQQDEHGFQHTSPTHYPSWPSPRSHWSATGPRNQHTTFRAKTHQHAQQKLARLAACAALVRPMACAGQTGDTGQTGG
jgi:hypothetical protein